jgi:hypothetical protein
MRIEDYEFEEEKTLANLADLLTKIADQLRENGELELPMPTLREGVIKLPIGEPVETGIEVALRKHFIHLKIALAWQRPTTQEEKSDE